ncbi:PIG-L family deacetylase [Albibacterium sp.]|uniref:PIG-L deacetylase family protein n=1 Tax=Albibacterium sp. TaxID=2952885 RepID=UPI002CF6E75E|nr:PIG-L family deacetylase [Albibacterium sp.]HUH18532.1 PIG-L family deacetylase [Albibacterium sp.]
MGILNTALDSAFSKGPIISDSNSLIIGNSLILVPHPDDESLACGGTIALLRKNGFLVYLIFITDGTMSHPNSKKYPAERLRDLREEEARKALNILNVNAEAIQFLRLPDSNMNKLNPVNFEYTSRLLQEYIIKIRPTTIFLPWRKDPHPDHIATWNLAVNAIKGINKGVFQSRVLEYPVWFWERTDASQLAQENEVNLWKVQINDVLIKKKHAILQHASQLGQIINDDPTGFTLSNKMLEHFYHKEELFFEYYDMIRKI